MGSMKIVIAAGGSGGHLLPAQQLAEELQKEAEVLFAGHRLDASPFFRRDLFSFQSISAAPLKFSVKGLLAFVKAMARGFLESVRLIKTFQPDVVVGFGSFHSFPLLLAASLMRRKIVLFEANCLLGKVNRLFAFDAKIVAAQFLLKKSPRHLRFVPLLPWKEQPVLTDKQNARDALGLERDRLTFLIFGGSQGAAFLNRTIPASLPAHAQAIHLAGKDEAAREVADRYRQAGILTVVKGFEPNMAILYAAADFAICRSGAATMAELIRYSLPALLIPFPFATDDHQRINAEFLVKKIGGAIMLFENAASAQLITDAIGQMMRESVNWRAALVQFRNVCEGRVSLSQQILQLGLML
jgi:UDP-N-acetylglucosamine--N-acetylmuramyl-(pentapeptide) pyrophosphoryl-undecaprenol N-acetylglucosamine transferase